MKSLKINTQKMYQCLQYNLNVYFFSYFLDLKRKLLLLHIPARHAPDNLIALSTFVVTNLRVVPKKERNKRLHVKM